MLIDVQKVIHARTHNPKTQAATYDTVAVAIARLGMAEAVALPRRPLTLVHSQDGVRNGEDAALAIDGLARVGARVLAHRFRDGQGAAATLRPGKKNFFIFLTDLCQ